MRTDLIILDTFYEKSYARMQIFGRALVEELFVHGRKTYRLLYS